MSDRAFLDTNVLLYSISDHPAESRKRDRARDLLDRSDCALSGQVLQESYVQATRSGRVGALSHDLAAGLIRSWLRFEIQDMTLAVMNAALEIRSSHGFSYWNSAITAAARTIGCHELYTEDLSHGRTIDGVTIIDPFR